MNISIIQRDMAKTKAAFVSGTNKRIPTAPNSDGQLERVMKLTFHIQNDSGVVPTVVTRDSGLSAEFTIVPQQAFLVAPIARILHLSPMNVPAPTPGCATGGTGGQRPTGTRAVVPKPIPRVDVAGVSLPGYAPGYKDRNQDAALLIDTFLSNRQQLLAVFDGHGPEGHRVSAFAKYNLPYTLLTQLIEEDGIRKGSAGASVSHDGGKAGGLRSEGSGSTAVQITSPSTVAPSLPVPCSPSALGPCIQTEAASGCCGGTLSRALWRTVTALDQQLEDSGIDVVNSGSTAALCHVNGRQVTAAWVGDSRMLLGLPTPTHTEEQKRHTGAAPSYEGGGLSSATRAAATGVVNVPGKGPQRNRHESSGNREWHVAWSSTDHKPELPEEARRIEAAGGRVARSVGRQGPVGPYRVWFQDQPFPGLAMSRALGDLPGRGIGVTCTPSCASLHLPNSGPAVLVLASDGVWELLSNQQVLELAAGAGSAAEAASRVVQQSRRAWVKEYGGSYVDDITALVMRLDMPQQRRAA